MAEKITIALIVAQPGPLRNSLQTLMTTMARIEIVAETRDISALLRLGARLPPDLVLIEAGLPNGDICAALSQIEAEWQNTHTIVLVETAEQEKQATSAGADLVLYKGFPAARLLDEIDRQLTTDCADQSCES